MFSPRLLVLVLLGSVLVPPAGAASPAPAITEATFNVLRTNNVRHIAADLDRVLAHAQIVRLQEAHSPSARTALGRVLARRPTWRTCRRAELVTAWDTRHATAAGPCQSWRTHRGRAHVSPDRFITAQALTVAGATALVVNTHAVSGYNRVRASPWRRAAARAHWTKMLQLTGIWALSRRYDVILLGGDFNAPPAACRAWYFPGPLLDPLYEPDKRRSIDQLRTARNPTLPVTVVRRWALTGLHSDHAAELRQIRYG